MVQIRTGNVQFLIYIYIFNSRRCSVPICYNDSDLEYNKKNFKSEIF